MNLLKRSYFLLIFLIIIWLVTIGNRVEAQLPRVDNIEVTNRTDGTMDFTVRTITYGGQYAPRHCFAIWICDASDQFVRTLEKRAATYQQHLVKWNQMTNGNAQGAVTSASFTSHQLHTVNWDCTDLNGTEVPDGFYRIYVEFTEDNSLPPGIPDGHWMMMEFEKNNQNQLFTPAGDAYYTDLELVFTPLPATEFVSFIAQQTANTEVRLEWTTAYENNVFGFSVLRAETDDINNALMVSAGLINATNTNQSVTYQWDDSDVQIGTTYYYWIQTTLMSGVQLVHGSVSITVTTVTAGEDLAPSVMDAISNYPNPFNPETTITFALSVAGKVEVDVFDIRGRKVRTLMNDYCNSGSHKLSWNGFDNTGQQVASGVYFARMKSDSNTHFARMVLLK
ncbi:MAG: DUF2271 domain-containing protein [Candidatus Cloacimonetes bacterium]|nr:DUF2271 domain-containing protein [Candidatus Cloacimonadota bacterium]